jgi:Glycosyltransferase family 87
MTANLRGAVEWLVATRVRRRALLHGAIGAGLLFNAIIVFAWGPRLLLWADAGSWWHIDLNNLYGSAEESLLALYAFRMAPVIAWLMLPLTWLPWSVYIPTFLALDVAAVVAMTRRWAPIFLVAFPPILLELINGNIHLFMGLAILVGMRWPAAWAFIFLTKVTPGVGVVWFAARREWRNLAIALGSTLVIAAIGVLIAPQLWIEWVRSLVISSGHEIPTVAGPLILRVPVAAALAWYAGQTDRAWLVPVACVVAMPTPWIQSTAILTASFPLYWERARFRRGHTDQAVDVAPLAAATDQAGVA